MIVVDCSALVDALTGVEGTGDLRVRLASEPLCAPALIDVEVVSALRGLVAGRVVSARRAGLVLDDLDDLALERWPVGPVVQRRAFDLRGRLTAYDAAYVTLAEALSCSLVTRDRKLARAAARLVPVEVL